MKKKIIIISKILVIFWILLLGTLIAFSYLLNKEDTEVPDPIATIFMVILGLTVLVLGIVFIIEIATSIKENEKYVFLKLLGEFIFVLFLCILIFKSYRGIEVLGFALGIIFFNKTIKCWKRN